MNSNYEQIVSFGKDNVEAMVKSCSVAAKGMEELVKLYAELANQSVEQTSSAIKALAAAKTPTDFQTTYSTIAGDQFTAFVSESKKVQELATTIVTDTMAPINARVQAMSSMVKVAA